MDNVWTLVIAVIFLLALGIFLILQWQHATRSRERQFNLTLGDPMVIGASKWKQLTSRQQQVARLAARGLSNAEIAQRLDIKPTTVNAHLKNIYATLDVHSRTELGYLIKDDID